MWIAAKLGLPGSICMLPLCVAMATIYIATISPGKTTPARSLAACHRTQRFACRLCKVIAKPHVRISDNAPQRKDEILSNMAPSQSFYVAFRIDEKMGDARSYFLSEGLESVQAWVANDGKRPSGAANHRSDPAHKAQDNGPSNQKKRQEFPFQLLTTKFIGSMNRLKLIIPTTMTYLPRLEITRLNRFLYEPVTKASKQISKSDTFEVYQCDFDQMRLFRTAGLYLHELKGGRNSLPGMFLMGLISSYDAFLSELMRLVFLTIPEMLSASEKNISFKDLVELGSIEAARNQIIEKEVETFLRQSHHAQFDILSPDWVSRCGKIWKFGRISLRFARDGIFSHIPTG
jgi:hypothetical protein